MKLPKKIVFTAEITGEDLADQRFFVLDDEKWKKFQKILNRPARVLPGLKRLMDEKSPWE
ncbi:type II toxin-antitoxin system TacA family antitoxin [Desulfonema ishimotonii]|nr:DUF1778 domain-containing protein [Desulfonema ishimotonii]